MARYRFGQTRPFVLRRWGADVSSARRLAADSILMVGAYSWAYVKPLRKLYYNMTITAVSVIVALLVGGIEAFGLLADKLGLHGKCGT